MKKTLFLNASVNALSHYPKHFRVGSITVPMLMVALAAPLSALAQSDQGQWEVSPFFGYQILDSGQNLEDAATFGLRLGYRFAPNWSVEGALSMTPTGVDDAELQDANPGQFSSPHDDVDLMLYQLDALYHFRPQNRFSPYLVGGIGGAAYSPSISDKDMTTFNLGAGAKYWMTENLALRFDLRNHSVGEVFDHTFHHLSATLGLSFAFGGRSAPRAETPREPAPVAAAAPVAREPAAVSAPKPVATRAVEFDNVHFEFDQATLSNEAKRSLRKVVTTLQQQPESKMRIAGNASASGTAEHNQALSERRAEAIKQYLVEQGIAANRLTTVGYGHSRPAAHEATPSNHESAAAKKNRRAQFELIVN